MKLQPPSAKDRQSVLLSWFQQGVDLQVARKFDEAETFYQAILKASPTHPETKRMLARMRLDQGRTEEALKLLRQALATDPRATAHAELGTVLAQLGRLQEAVDCYDRALDLQPNVAETHGNRAVMLLELGRASEAAEGCRRALALKPGFVHAHYNLGNALKAMGRLPEALASYDAALALDRRFVNARNNRGLVLAELGRQSEALASFDQALGLQPRNADVHNNRAVTLVALDRAEGALVAANEALHCRPGYPEAFNNRGMALSKLGRHAEALADYDRAIEAMPHFAASLNNAGNALRQLDRLDDALARYEGALRLQPDYLDAMNNRGIALNQLGRQRHALASFEAALALDPRDAQAGFNRGLLQLQNGNLAEGWSGYERRFDQADSPARRYTGPEPVWRGEPLAGRRIIVYEEQGLGDILQFSRYLPLLAADGAEVTFLVRAGMHRLLQPLASVARLVATPPDGTQDFQCALLSLPAACRTTLRTIPPPLPALAAETERMDVWRERIGPAGFKIGIAWQGNPDGQIDIGRSIPLAAFAPLCKVPGTRLISLQKTHGLDQLQRLPAAMSVETLGPEFDAGPDFFVDTAAAMMALDLIVTSDTSIAHLAGTLGRPVWLALRHVPDWRWLLDRRDSPWYPTMRLYRQTKRGDWASVFTEMTRDLDRRAI